MITKVEVVKGLKRVLEEIGVEYYNILIFGSRAEKDFDEWSDWDFLIILKKNLDSKEKRDIRYKIYRKFHEKFPLVSIDIILKDKVTFENEKNITNTISNEAYLEGIEI